MKIIIVDDDCLVAGALKTILEVNEDVEVLATGADGKEACELYERYEPDVLLMDIRMEKMDGLEASRSILSRYPKANILLLTTFSDDEYIVKALRLGAKGYLLKQDYGSILPALRAVYCGQTVFGTEIVSRIPDLLQGERKFDYGKYDINEREFEMIELIANGYSNKEIAAELLNLYYNNEIEPFLNSCHEDVLWIGPADKQVIRGRKNLVDAFHAEKHELKFSLNNLTVLPLATTSSTVAEIMTFMLVDTIWPDNSASRVNQRMQFTWVEQKGVPKIRVIFISNAIQYDERDGIYPVHYDENYRKFVLTGETRSERIYVKGIDKSILYLNWSRVIYVESLGNHTVIHTLDQEFESTESLKTLEKRYGNLFLKCHESYMVNPAHVHSIRRFKMTVTGGRELPVPEKKYTAVKKTLQKIIVAR